MKRVTVCLEHRFFEHSGKLYTKLAFPYDYWKDYLQYFDKVTIAARVQPTTELLPEMVRVDGEKVSFTPLPYYVGPIEFIKKIPSLIISSYFVSKRGSHFILRSGNITNMVWPFILINRKPYLREYPGNIKEGIAGYAGESLLIKLVSSLADLIAKLQGRFSKANSFVSYYCRDLYASEKPSHIFSSFRSTEISEYKTDYSIKKHLSIVSVGRIEKEKGHEILIKAISHLRKKTDCEINLHLIGDGTQKKHLEKLAKELGVSCTFYGAITDRQKLFKIMRDSNLFIIPSLTEGMPRALLEAMAIGLPCLGSRTGGIPEVLSDECMFEPGKYDTITASIEKLLSSPQKMQAIGVQNRDLIKEKFCEEKALSSKVSFWSKLYE